MRSQILFIAALLSTAAFAQRTLSTDDALKASPKEGTTVVGGTVNVTGSTSMVGSGFIQGGVVDLPLVAIVMDRDFRDAIQGNMDRETIEHSNGETR